MSSPTLARLREADIPWILHVATLTISPYFLPSPSVYTFAILYILASFLLDAETLLAALQHPDEPPMIPHPYLPFLGHVLGMFLHGASYFARVNASTNYPIYTILTLTGRTVIVTDPYLAGTIQKASKNTSFYGMILEVTKRLVDLDDTSMDVICWNINGEHGAREGLMLESSHMVAGELSPGPSLNELSSVQMEHFPRLLNNFVSKEEGVETSLMDFVKEIFTVANALTFYGPQNPFAMNPGLFRDFWTWERGMIAVMVGVFPQVTARKPYLARRAVNDALEAFVAKEHYRSASPMISKRVQINLKHGLTTKMAGHAELIMLFGIVGNAVPTVFWVLANVFARPALLEQLRKETSKAVTCIQSHAEAPKEKKINVTRLKGECPLLVSVYRETLRTIANLSSVRLVTNTHAVTAPGHRTYSLRKGSMVQIASGVIHMEESIWGPDARNFNPVRFISTATNEQSLSLDSEHGAGPLPKVPSAAYRGFGGGSVICPGRHFAQNEILGFVALCIHSLDIVDAETNDVFALPSRDDEKIPLSVMKPVREPRVLIKRKEGEQAVMWTLEL